MNNGIIRLGSVNIGYEWYNPSSAVNKIGIFLLFTGKKVKFNL